MSDVHVRPYTVQVLCDNDIIQKLKICMNVYLFFFNIYVQKQSYTCNVPTYGEIHNRIMICLIQYVFLSNYKFKLIQKQNYGEAFPFLKLKCGF